MQAAHDASGWRHPEVPVFQNVRIGAGKRVRAPGGVAANLACEHPTGSVKATASHLQQYALTATYTCISAPSFLSRSVSRICVHAKQPVMIMHKGSCINAVSRVAALRHGNPKECSGATAPFQVYTVKKWQWHSYRGHKQLHDPSLVFFQPLGTAPKRKEWPLAWQVQSQNYLIFNRGLHNQQNLPSLTIQGKFRI